MQDNEKEEEIKKDYGRAGKEILEIIEKAKDNKKGNE